jgi:hypothetical protein
MYLYYAMILLSSRILVIKNLFLFVGSILLAIVISLSITSSTFANVTEKGGIQPLECPITETCCGGKDHAIAAVIIITKSGIRTGL